MKSVLDARDLKKTYQIGQVQVLALAGVSFVVKTGEFVAIVGASGSGKSTLLHLLGGLDRPSAGSVVLNGVAIESLSERELARVRRQQLGFVFQAFNLLPAMSALENVALPLLLDGQSMNEAGKRAQAELERLGLGDRAAHRPGELSGGEMQRVAIARALVTRPLVLLADEPTGNLDTKAGAAVLEILRRLSQEEGQTVVLVTHDTKAAALASRLITLGDGRVESDRFLKP